MALKIPSATELLPGLIRFGNSKLPKTTAIFNMTSATDCVALALGLCHVESVPGRRYCYALHDEQQFPRVLPFRRRQAKAWNEISAEVFAAVLFKMRLDNPFRMLRFNEAGDFRNQADVDKAEGVAARLSGAKILTHAYTSRSDLNFRNLLYLKVIGSGFRSPGTMGEFKIVAAGEDPPEGYLKCPGSCVACDACMRGQLVYTRKHGPGRPAGKGRKV